MKRILLYLFLLVGLLVPSLLNANNISVIGNISTNSLDIIDLDSHTIEPVSKRPILADLCVGRKF